MDYESNSDKEHDEEFQKNEVSRVHLVLILWTMRETVMKSMMKNFK